MKRSKKIIALILIFAICISLLVVPASADSSPVPLQFFKWALDQDPNRVGFFESLGISLDNDCSGCPNSPNGMHDWVDQSGLPGLIFDYHSMHCFYCGMDYLDYVPQAYDDAVSELPVDTITSDGGLIWYMPLYGIYDGANYNFASNPISGNTIHHTVKYHYGPDNSPDIYYSAAIPIVGHTSILGFVSPLSVNSPYSVTLGAGGQIKPLNGHRTYLFTFEDGFTSSSPTDLFAYNFDSLHNAGEVLGVYFCALVSGGTYYDSWSYDLTLPSAVAISIIPDQPFDVTSGDTYNIDNRVGSLVGNYTYEGDNGTQIIAEDIRIVNETDQSVYNPVTNETYYYNEYTYNYGDRSYDFSFGDRDDHVSVTYGDDCVTIEDGDHTYTIYYTTASNHEHSYRITRVIDPTCTEQGKIYKTCSECGDELIEFTDALGHDWQITEQTAVDYVLPEARCPACESQYFIYELVDEVFYCVCQDCGEEWNCNADVTEGHTTYTCSRCGEERTETNQEQDLSLFEAIGDLLADTFEWITDKLGQFINSLSGLSESFSSRIESIIESVGNYPLLFGAFLAGMPDDLMNIVWFGVIALVFVLVWKKFFS